jgi:hypothetical protein
VRMLQSGRVAPPISRRRREIRDVLSLILFLHKSSVCCCWLGDWSLGGYFFDRRLSVAGG